LEEVFGGQLASLISGSEHESEVDVKPILSIDNTLLDVSVSIARSDGIEHNILKWRQILDLWRHRRHLYRTRSRTSSKYGPKPVVAIISENHPYVLAILFATWKLGGVFAPLDYQEILERMLHNIAPICVLAPSTRTQPVLQKILKGEFYPSNFSMSASGESFSDQKERHHLIKGCFTYDTQYILRIE
jgi:acyl-CoA synthetase (AMP-forming)/AMP-acid ligase II